MLFLIKFITDKFDAKFYYYNMFKVHMKAQISKNNYISFDLTTHHNYSKCYVTNISLKNDLKYLQNKFNNLKVS